MTHTTGVYYSSAYFLKKLNMVLMDDDHNITMKLSFKNQGMVG